MAEDDLIPKKLDSFEQQLNFAAAGLNAEERKEFILLASNEKAALKHIHEKKDSPVAMALLKLSTESLLAKRNEEKPTESEKKKFNWPEAEKPANIMAARPTSFFTASLDASGRPTIGMTDAGEKELGKNSSEETPAESKPPSPKRGFVINALFSKNTSGPNLN